MQTKGHWEVLLVHVKLLLLVASDTLHTKDVTATILIDVSADEFEHLSIGRLGKASHTQGCETRFLGIHFFGQGSAPYGRWTPL